MVSSVEEEVVVAAVVGPVVLVGVVVVVWGVAVEGEGDCGGRVISAAARRRRFSPIRLTTARPAPARRRLAAPAQLSVVTSPVVFVVVGVVGVGVVGVVEELSGVPELSRLVPLLHRTRVVEEPPRDL